jgi:hypothetical protein
MPALAKTHRLQAAGMSTSSKALLPPKIDCDNDVRIRIAPDTQRNRGQSHGVQTKKSLLDFYLEGFCTNG